MKRLKKLQHHLQPNIDEVINRLVSECKNEYDISHVKGFIADVDRGVAHFDGQFTVPLWAFDRRHKGRNYRGDEGYFIYYVAHELSHQVYFKKHGYKGRHNANFYEIFKDLCPKEYQHFELNYIPSSKRFGIKSLEVSK